ncbi:tetratricopeptide repeat protein [Desulfoglaeba alkanexedens]|uniref:protein O-GlcNAc transferase n=1 Tax=Desulfoglaeba alkanexedens ALDC TaxID=980445 RepID=A0A4V1ERE3_9BACT|nr:tetratricopeptide repeat protein [Desulfoglaeba alkanexedens]QCQ21341.1 tetratricopeptide repeat protein [Desulfoglaeba alkanexedens ALDC]
MLANAFVAGMPPVPEPPVSVFQRPPRAGRKLRIGLLSADFKQHPVAQLIMEVLEHIDRRAFELIGYDVAEPHESYWRQRILAAFDEVVAVRDLDEKSFVERLRQDKLDVLVEMQGDTADTRVWWLRHRLAPVQMSWLGFIGSIGAGMTDYIIADRHLIPADSRQHFAEKVIWLPDFSFPADTQREAPPPPPRVVEGLPDDAVVFCSFNAHYKITRATFEAWLAIVQQVEKGILWLYDQNPDSTARLRQAAKDLGLAEERLIFAKHKPHIEHLARLQLADVALDSWPYNSGATAIDTLWCGVPLLTKSDATMMSRVATGMLKTLGLPELTTTTVEEFIRTGVRLGRDAGLRRDIKERLIAARDHSPLYDPQRFARHLEKAFDMAYARFEQGLAPDHLEVPALESAPAQDEAAAARSLQVLLERADYYLQKEKLDEAEPLFREALARDPASPMARYGLGMIHGLRGQYEQALELMQQAAQAEPDNARFSRHLEIMQKKAQKNHLAELQALLKKGLTSHQKGDKDAAESCYRAILETSPRHPMALHYLGLIEVQRGDPAGLEKIRRSLEIQPHNPTFLQNFEKAKKIVPDNQAQEGFRVYE